jgi:hypothetical protein
MSDIDRLLDAAHQQGWGVERRKSGHFMLTPPSRGSPLIVVSGTAGDHRAYAKIRCQLRRAGLVLPADHTPKETNHMAKRTTTTPTRPTATTTTPAKASRSQRASAASGKTAVTRVPRRSVIADVDSDLMPLTAAQTAQVDRETRAATRGDTLQAETKLDRDLAYLGDPQAGRRVPSRRRREPDEESLVYRGKRGRGPAVDQHIDIIVPDEENDERIYELQATISGLDEDSQREAWARAAALRNRAPAPYVPLTDRLTVSGISYHFELGKSTLVHVDDVDYLLSYPAYVIERVGDDPDESGLPAAIRRRNATALANQQRRAS